MEKAMLIPARSLTRGWKLHAKHQLWHPLLPHTWCSRGNRGEKCKYISADRAFLLRAQLFFSLPQTKVQYCQNSSCAEEQKTFRRHHLFPQSVNRRSASCQHCCWTAGADGLTRRSWSTMVRGLCGGQVALVHLPWRAATVTFWGTYVGLPIVRCREHLYPLLSRRYSLNHTDKPKL